MFQQFSRPILNRLIGKVDRFPWQNRRLYGNYLAQTYYYTSHSVRLLGLMLSKTPVENGALYNYLVRHIKEENHHEQLALSDLRDLGFGIEEFPELDATRMLWEPQYYKISEIGVPAAFGYVMMLELLAVERAPWIASQVEGLANSGKCNRFMEVHGKEDVSHVERGFTQMESFEAAFHEPIRKNMSQTAAAFGFMLDIIGALNAD